MSFDGTVLAAVVHELNPLLTGGYIQRVYQPAPLEVELRIRSHGEHRLLLSADPASGRVHLTGRPADNPQAPPAFCMLLRKHLEGGRVTGIAQDRLERTVVLSVENRNELYDRVSWSLVAEIMGKHANIILVAGDGTVADAVKRIGPGLSRVRHILPGLTYTPPPDQGKLDPLGSQAAELAASFRNNQGPAWRRIFDTTLGVGPVTARELCARAGLDPETPGDRLPPESFAALAAAVVELGNLVRQGNFVPTWATSEGADAVHARRRPVFAAIDLTGLPAEGRRHEETMSDLLDRLYGWHAEGTGFGRLETRLRATVTAALERLHRKADSQAADLARARGDLDCRRLGELLTASLHRVQPGTDAVAVSDWYDPEGGTVIIPLNPSLSPAGNAQALFRRYNRAKRTLEKGAPELEKTQTEIGYLEGVENSLDQVSTRGELEEIEEELARQGTFGRSGPGSRGRAPQGRGRRERETGTTCLRYRSSGGLEILVGKNNRQNDQLTMRQAKPGDLWLHTKDIPGSHVILRLGDTAPERLEDLPNKDLEEAALLAAFHSKARASANVPVDYTFRRHVWKPRGARPGMVLYRHHRTAFVTPAEARVDSLKPRP